MKIDDAALQISYACEGVRDQRAINYMMAQSLIVDPGKYRVAREQALYRFPDLPGLRVAIRIMDEFHLVSIKPPVYPR